MKEYTVTQVYGGMWVFQNIRAKSREEAIELARNMEDEECVNSSLKEAWFAEVEEE